MIHRHRVKRHRVKRHKVKRQTVKNATKGKNGIDRLGGRALWLLVYMNIKHNIKICIISGLG